MAEIKAIETRFKGYRFRSRLEARWACFFEALGIQWEYEPEGFELPMPENEPVWEGDQALLRSWNGVDPVHYLPDFLVNDGYKKFWLEIKPDEPDAEAICKIGRLCRTSPLHAFIAIGSPYVYQREFIFAYWVYSGRFLCTDLHRFATCPLCKKTAFLPVYEFTPKQDQRWAESWLVRCDCLPKKHWFQTEFNPCLNRSLVRAYESARGARFDHGESGPFHG